MKKNDIKGILEEAEELARTKTKNELLELIGKEVSKVKFQDKFKPGDIICSDRFHNGLCMIVESVKESWRFDDDRWRYSCIDLVKEHQRWHAYERDDFMFEFNYNWRIATDDDIANYLSRFVHIQVPKIGNWNVELMDDGIMLDDGGDYSVLLDAEELAQLGKLINERVIT